MANNEETMMFRFGNDENKAEKIIRSVCAAMEEKGYNPINQLVGYLLSGDPAYVTSHNDARSKIRTLERDELLEELVRSYLEKREQEMKRYMSLDIGDRTIGIAVSDLLGLTAQGVETIRRKSLADDLKRLGELMEMYETKSLVSGLPKNMDGTEGDRCAIVKEFMAEVKKAYPDVEVFFWDERLSTVAATRSLIEADVSRRKRKKVIDKMAAVFILQGFLDSKR